MHIKLVPYSFSLIGEGQDEVDKIDFVPDFRKDKPFKGNR